MINCLIFYNNVIPLIILYPIALSYTQMARSGAVERNQLVIRQMRFMRPSFLIQQPQSQPFLVQHI